MRRFMFGLTLSLAIGGGRSQASDFPFEPIVLSDGVLLINKTNGQNWIMESGAPRPPGMPRSWNLLQLPGLSMPTNPQTAPHGTGGPMVPGGPSGTGFSGPGFMGPGYMGPGYMGPGYMGPGLQQGGFHPGFNPWMPQQPQNGGPNVQHPPSIQPGPQAFLAVPPGTAPPGSYARNIPPESIDSFHPRTAPPQQDLPTGLGSDPYALPSVSPPTDAPEPITASELLPRPTDVLLPGPPSSPEHEQAPKVPNTDDGKKFLERIEDSPTLPPPPPTPASVAPVPPADHEDRTSESNHEQPIVMIAASDSEIDLDEVLVLRLSAITPTSRDGAKAKITVTFPADGKLVRGGNPSSISDDHQGDANSVNMSHDGTKPLDLVFRFAKPGKKPIKIAIEALGQTATTTFSVMVEADDDDDDKERAEEKSSKEKKPSSGTSQKRDSHRKK